jgi:septation ring formation regulator EzrA
MLTGKEENVFRGNEVMLMLESMSDGIAVIAEEQKATRIEMNKKFDIVDEKFDIVNEKFDIVNEKFAIIDEKFDTVFEFLSRIKDELVELRQDLNKLEKTKTSKSDLLAFGKRLSILEKKFEKIEA